MIAERRYRVLKEKVKMILASKNYSYRDTAPAFNGNAEVAAVKLSRGIKSLSDFVKLCDYCEAEVAVTLNNGTIIRITKEDIK